jgi:hypothetical protein
LFVISCETRSENYGSSIDFQKNNFAALSVGNGRKRPIPSLLPCEMNFLKAYNCDEHFQQAGFRALLLEDDPTLRV